ncbi:MAG: HD domain-containing protein [Lachnospiraceae bacterium]|nr:HD domain-containing protein [Lachnospiraceae bacterium]
MGASAVPGAFYKTSGCGKKRVFCNHTLSHFLDVARIAYILALQEHTLSDEIHTADPDPASGLANILSRELIYATAFLHDIGRWEQISQGTPHEKASARLAGEIMPDCEFTPDEVRTVQYAILAHRSHPVPSSNTSESARAESDPCLSPAYSVPTVPDAARLLAGFLYYADKQSRCCFACPVSDKCNWTEEQKNQQIQL